jgi:carboxyl-terminal processing protease
MPVKDVVKLIRGPKGTEVRLTVKKPDGSIRIIPIVRDKVVLEDTYVRSDIIEDHASGKKYGYIYLPIFYHDFNNRNGRNAADDMRKEIANLMDENISGIILDLRNNGGGSLDDAIKITGLFIKGGPVVQVNNGHGWSSAYPDPDPEIVYSGPLVVMINSLSASASEIVAAALQDYGRAVIVGDRTFGKGTVQQVVDLDSSPLFNSLKPLGSIKLTVQKFYRINGDSTQLKGVTGDIPLPDPYSAMDMGESSMDYPLPWDSTTVLDYNKWDVTYNMEELKDNSKKRVSRNKIFNLITSNAQIMSREINSPKSLQLSKLMEEQKTTRDLGDGINKLLDSTNLFEVEIPKGEMEEGDYSDRKDKMEAYLKTLSKDIYAEEAVNILGDMNEEIK